ncbi:MAG: single-stranded DNA-binding protein [Clostridia bacterium]|nr:single-stranded DNA-binding protein [Clostridia bacterium]
MADLSKYLFTGRLGNDAVVRTTPNGKKVMEMSVAVNTGYGEYKETMWIKVNVWGDKVDTLAPMFTKGAIVAGAGEPKVNSWVNKNNETQAELQVRCLNVEILSSKKKDEAPSAEQTSPDVVF